MNKNDIAFGFIVTPELDAVEAGMLRSETALGTYKNFELNGLTLYFQMLLWVHSAEFYFPTLRILKSTTP